MLNLSPRTLACAALSFHLNLLTACAEAPQAPQPTPSAVPATALTPATTPTQPAAPLPTLTFEEWRAQLRSDALNAGIDAALFDRAFAG
ncbi:MAG: lytic murein transglycosylase, partial [Pseudomonas sp.]